MMSPLQTTEFEISLFPIPGSVSLPFSLVPLHIFEPRYRQMFADSIAQKRRIGVAHTIRVSAPSTFQFATQESELLNLDQETYEAHSIFSAGYAEISETFEDGRILAQIQMDSRFEVIEVLQEKPYKIVRCREYQDEKSADASATELRLNLDRTLMELPGEELAPLRQYIQNPIWKSMSTMHYSFAVYSVVLFQADILQKVLELKSPLARMQFMQRALDQRSAARE